jgi:RimJ/RimL family protein N-acetyltransferase
MSHTPEFSTISDGIVTIKNFAESHLTEEYVSWLNDPEVVKFSEQRHILHTLDSCSEYFAAKKRSDDYFLAVEHCLGDVNVHVGNIGVSVDSINRAADLSIMIGNKQYWNGGYGSRAWTMTMRHLLNVLGFRIVTAGTMATNEPMISLMKKSGMSFVGTVPSRFLVNDMEVGMVMSYRLQADEV